MTDDSKQGRSCKLEAKIELNESLAKMIAKSATSLDRVEQLGLTPPAKNRFVTLSNRFIQRLK